MNAAISEILIEDSIQDHPWTKAAIQAQTRHQGFTPTLSVIAEKQKVEGGKQTLLLQKSRGELFHPCPGTQGAVCCNYFVFDFLSGCPFHCSYCYLNAYLSQTSLSMQINLEDPVGRLVERFRREPQHLFRVGTGEIADSLALPASDPLNRYLVETFANEPNTQLELKTKSSRIDPLLDLNPKGRVVISWSMSPPSLSQVEEQDTATPYERLQAARKVYACGYRVGFHLDPLLFAHPDWTCWERDYEELLQMIFQAVPPQAIAWISLGGLRLIKGLRESMMKNFPDSLLAYAEMLPGSDGKLRYPKPIRKRMFQTVKNMIDEMTQEKAPPVYLCMENREVWRGSFGNTPEQKSNLRPLFNHALPKTIALLP